MRCPLCETRKGRRGCPALRQSICPVCCATKRLTEIACPPDCPYLASAREHPAAVVRRQQERDVAIILPTLQGLTERQLQLFFLFQTAIVGYDPPDLTRVLDADVAEAAGALASTLETAARGVIYEHSAQSPPARHLLKALTTALAELRRQGTTVFDAEAAAALRAIEQGARDAQQTTGGGEAAYLTLMARLVPADRRRRTGAVQAAAPTLIVP